MRDKQSKAGKVKDVRRVLAQFGVDVQKLHLSVHASSVDMSGSLVKYDGSGFAFGEISALVNALSSFGHLTTDLTEWDLTNGEIVKLSSEAEVMED